MDDKHMPTTRQPVYKAAALAAMVGLTGCASVTVMKVDSQTGKIQADTPEGLRFYMPRPYVSVHEPFVISSETYLAQGEVSPDSAYVLLTEVPAAIRSLVVDNLGAGAGKSMGDLRVDASAVRVPSNTGQNKSKADLPTVPGRPQGAEPAEPGASSPAPSNDTSTPPQKDETPTPDTGNSPPISQKPEVAGGIVNVKTTNDNTAFAVTPQPRYFNILWLPDFDQQYVISAKGGMGNAGVVINYGQGWSLQGLDSKVDNSAPLKPIMDFYSWTLGALQKLASAKINAAIPLVKGSAQAADPENPNPTAANFTGGTKVTVKIMLARVVAPGLYPILKPSELLNASLPDAAKQRILQPSPPFTNIAFNTYQTVMLEAARPSGDSPVPTQAPSPGQSDNGTATQGQGMEKKLADTPQQPGDTNAAQRDINGELSNDENKSKKGEYYTARVSGPQAGIYSVTLDKVVNANKPGKRSQIIELNTVKEIVKKIMDKNGLTTDKNNIKLAQPSGSTVKP